MLQDFVHERPVGASVSAKVCGLVDSDRASF
jgi:hypothetical protein